MTELCGVSHEIQQVGVPGGWSLVSDEAIASLRHAVDRLVDEQREIVRLINDNGRRIERVEAVHVAQQATDERQDHTAATVTAEHHALARALAEHTGRFTVLYGVLAGIGVVALTAVVTTVLAVMLT